MADESSPKTGRGHKSQVSGPQTSPPYQPKAMAAPQPIRSEDLLQGSREVQILHAGELYRLTLTRAGKLILHK